MRSPLLYRDRRAVLLWLGLCIFLVAMMVLVGGYTRLSGSGLSITSWKPVHGTIPPLNAQEWQDEFIAYQTSPQYQKVNNGMTLEEFRVIFWPEFIHRLLGRVVGAVFFLPLAVFFYRRSISKRLGLRLLGIFALGGLQGLVGWLMVKSGLVDTPQVSPIRLAAHLSVAFAILALLLWAWLDIGFSRPHLTGVKAPVWRYYVLWFGLLCVQIILGAFMAGLHGGLIYNTWPTMDGQWVPSDLLAVSPWYANITLVQFLHRKLAIILAAGYAIAWIVTRKYVTNIQLKVVSGIVAGIISVQFILGIMTLLYQAPLPLALAHQMTGLLLFAAAVVLLHTLSSLAGEKSSYSPAAA